MNKKISIPTCLKINKEKNPFIIAIEGPNGVGKTTLCNKISKKYNIYNSLCTPEEWMEPAIKERMILDAKWLPSALYFFSGTMEIQRELKDQFSTKDLIIMDRSFWSTLAVNWIEDIERIDFLLSLAAESSKFLLIPDFIIILTANYKTCKKRIKLKGEQEKKLDQVVNKKRFLKELDFYNWLEKELENVIKIDTSNMKKNDVIAEMSLIINDFLQ